MATVSWQGRVTTDPAIHHGEPCIKGTRIPVRIILGSLADGMSQDDVRDQYPQLDPDDIVAALAYAADVVGNDGFVPF